MKKIKRIEKWEKKMERKWAENFLRKLSSRGKIGAKQFIRNF